MKNTKKRDGQRRSHTTDGLAGGDVTHTRGPWRYVDQAGVYDGIGVEDEHGRTIALTQMVPRGVSLDECEGNAHLIAAAPAMLAACRAAEAALQSCYEVTEFPADGKSDCDCALAALRDAMAQAMGEPANNPDEHRA